MAVHYQSQITALLPEAGGGGDLNRGRLLFPTGAVG